MALSSLRPGANCTSDAQVHGHRNRSRALSRESGERNNSDPLLPGSGRHFIGSTGAGVARVRASCVACSSGFPERSAHAANRSCISGRCSAGPRCSAGNPRGAFVTAPVSAQGLGCVKTPACCSAVEWRSHASDSDVLSVSREARLPAHPQMQRCRNLENSAAPTLLVRGPFMLLCVERWVIWRRIGMGF